MTADVEPFLLKPVAAAELLAISPRTLWELTKTGKIPHKRIKERLLRYDPIALREWISSSANEGKV